MTGYARVEDERLLRLSEEDVGGFSLGMWPVTVWNEVSSNTERGHLQELFNAINCNEIEAWCLKESEVGIL